MEPKEAEPEPSNETPPAEAEGTDPMEAEIGQCCHCGGLGYVGNFCATCLDSGLIYEPGMDAEAEEADSEEAETGEDEELLEVESAGEEDSESR